MLLIDDEKAEDFLFFNFMWEFCVCLFALCMPGTQVRQKSQIPLQELQMVVSNYVGAGNQTQIFWKNSKMLLIFEPSLQCPLSNFFNFQIPAEMNWWMDKLICKHS